MSSLAPGAGYVLPAMKAVQAVAMLACEPPAEIAAEIRKGLREQAGLDDAAIDALVDQARGIMEGKAPQ